MKEERRERSAPIAGSIRNSNQNPMLGATGQMRRRSE
jgi:hypothetical protein